MENMKKKTTPVSRLIFIVPAVFIFALFFIVRACGVAADEAWDTYPLSREEAEENGMYFYDTGSPDGGVGLLAYDPVPGVTELTVPSSIDGRRVTEIGGGAFLGNTSLVSVIIPPSVINIGANAFYGTALQAVEIGEGTESIGDNAFGGSALVSVMIPAGVRSLGYRAFGNCMSLESVTVKGALTEMYDPFGGSRNLRHVYVDSCLCDTEAVRTYSSPEYTEGDGAEVVFSGHRLVTSWSDWTRTHNHFDISGNPLWNGSYRHFRTAVCSVCGEAYEFEDCDLRFPDTWIYYSTASHAKTGICSVCGDECTLLEDHNGFTEWKKVSASKHSRQFTCSICGGSGTQNGSHEFVNGEWLPISTEKHSRDKTCTVCGYSESTSARHTFIAVSVDDISDGMHRICEKCSVCSYEKSRDEEHYDSDGDGECDMCGHSLDFFSVIIPLSMPVVMNENGEVAVPGDISIVNMSSGEIEVSAVRLDTCGEWTLVPYDTDMAHVKVDSNLVGFSLNGEESRMTGTSEILLPSSPWTIVAGGRLPLIYEASLSPTSTPFADEEIMTVTFTVSRR